MDENPQINSTSGRQSAKRVLEDWIARQDAKADSGRVLLDIIPWSALSKEQEQKLWIFVCNLTF